MAYANNYKEFLAALADNESGGKGDHKATNGSYKGRYQLGNSALIDAGYMKEEVRRVKNRKTGKIVQQTLQVWTGKNGIHSKKDFLNSPAAQEDAVRAYHKKLWSYIKEAELDQYVGKTINGVEITPFGLLAAAHLKGVGIQGAQNNDAQGLRHYLQSGGKIDPKDGNGTRISEYLKEMAGYDEGRAGDNFPLPLPQRRTPFALTKITPPLPAPNIVPPLPAPAPQTKPPDDSYWARITNALNAFWKDDTNGLGAHPPRPPSNGANAGIIRG